MAVIYPFRRKGRLGRGNPIGDTDTAFRVAHRLSGYTAYVDVEGELDFLTAPRLREVLSMILEGRIKPDHLVIDLSKVTFMDSTGYLAIEDGVRESGWKGEFEIKDPSPQVRRLVELIWQLPVPSDGLG
ncbi:MAG TPA: STAS domain-containing protein [Acidimicrobiia bacterium]|nr:STAS domain-containing protein [Acidimicrobiia bacterium]